MRRPRCRRGAGREAARSAHRRTDLSPSEVPLNSGEGLRAAYYVEWDPASYSSLKQHVQQIDLLFPEWLHVVKPDGGLTSYTIDNRPFKVVDQRGVHPVDRENKVARTIAQAGEDTEIFPLVNNYDPVKGIWLESVGDFLSNADARANFLSRWTRFLRRIPTIAGCRWTSKRYRRAAQPGLYGAAGGAL